MTTTDSTELHQLKEIIMELLEKSTEAIIIAKRELEKYPPGTPDHFTQKEHLARMQGSKSSILRILHEHQKRTDKSTTY